MKSKNHGVHFLLCFLAFDYLKFTLRSLLKGRNGYELHAGIVVYLFTLQSVEFKEIPNIAVSLENLDSIR